MQNEGLRTKLRRIRALVRKETYQIVRDPSTIMIGVAMPIMMILLLGYSNLSSSPRLWRILAIGWGSGGAFGRAKKKPSTPSITVRAKV